MEGIFIALIVLGTLMVFRSISFLRPIADFVFWVIRGALSTFIGIVFGAIIGYYWFSNILVGSAQFNISDNTSEKGRVYRHVFVNALLGDEARVDGIDLDPIRDKILICIVIGAFIGLFVFIQNSIKAVKRKWKTLRMCEDVIKLTELKYEGKISEEEYEMRKEELFNS